MNPLVFLGFCAWICDGRRSARSDVKNTEARIKSSFGPGFISLGPGFWKSAPEKNRV